jgi:hypothetical protein
MDDQATAHRHDKKPEGNPIVPTPITVTLTPGNPQPNKEVPCQLHVAPPGYLVDDAIWLSPTEEYNIMFNLPGGGPRTWDVGGNPFCNMKGKCPTAANGTTDGFQVTAKGPNAITVNVPRQDPKAVQHYRMNFDNGYTCDPIIIVGEV